MVYIYKVKSGVPAGRTLSVGVLSCLFLSEQHVLPPTVPLPTPFQTSKQLSSPLVPTAHLCLHGPRCGSEILLVNSCPVRLSTWVAETPLKGRLYFPFITSTAFTDLTQTFTDRRFVRGFPTFNFAIFPHLQSKWTSGFISSTCSFKASSVYIIFDISTVEWANFGLLEIRSIVYKSDHTVKITGSNFPWSEFANSICVVVYF